MLHVWILSLYLYQQQRTTPHAMTTITELTEQQIEAIVAKLPLPAVTEQQEKQLMEDFADNSRKLLMAVLYGDSNVTDIKRRYKAYRTYRLEAQRWDEWMSANSCKFDVNRGKYVAII